MCVWRPVAGVDLKSEGLYLVPTKENNKGRRGGGGGAWGQEGLHTQNTEFDPIK